MVQTAFFSITGIITFLCSINKSRFYILHIRIHYFLCLSVLTVSHNSHLKVMQLLNVDQKRHIQDKEDLIKMLKCGFQTSTVLVELNQNSNIEACLIDIKYAYIISVDTHFTYVFHDYLQLELIFFFFFSKMKDNNKQTLLLKFISYINVPYINQQMFIFIDLHACDSLFSFQRLFPFISANLF